MVSEVNSAIAEARATLQKHLDLLSEDPFFELGANSFLLNGFVAELENVLDQLQRLEDVYGIDRDVRAANAYTEAVSCIEQHLEFLCQLQTQPFGTREHTKQAQQNLSASIEALAPLLPRETDSGQGNDEVDLFGTLKAVRPQTGPSSSERTKLFETLCSGFNMDEIYEICFQMQIEYEDLLGGTRKRKAMSLIEFAERHGRVEELMSKMLSLRPNLFSATDQ